MHMRQMQGLKNACGLCGERSPPLLLTWVGEG